MAHFRRSAVVSVENGELYEEEKPIPSKRRMSQSNMDEENEANVPSTALMKSYSYSDLDDESASHVSSSESSRPRRSYVSLNVAASKSDVKTKMPVIYTTQARGRPKLPRNSSKKLTKFSDKIKGYPSPDTIPSEKPAKSSYRKSVVISTNPSFILDNEMTDGESTYEPHARRSTSTATGASGWPGARSIHSGSMILGAPAGLPSKVMRRFYDETGPALFDQPGMLRRSSSVVTRRMSSARARQLMFAAAAEERAQEELAQTQANALEAEEEPAARRLREEERVDEAQAKSPMQREGLEYEDPMRPPSVLMLKEFPTEMPPLVSARRNVCNMGREYCTRYRGTWGPYGTPEGYGSMTRPFQVEYEGEFQDGVCHGVGALHYPNAAVVRGVWDHGHLLEPTYFSPDGMEYDPNGPYCKMPDRRYYTEIQRGLRPAGRSQLTNQHPPRPVPPGCYDAGDGIFDPRRNCVYDPETLDVLRVPTVNEMAWIKKNCRKGWDENVGYRPDLFENWEKPPEPAKQKDMEEEEEAKVEEEEEEPKEEEEGEEVQVEEERERAEEEDKLLDVEEVTMHPEMKETYPPVAVQDFTLDAAPPVDILPSLFPETEGEPQTVKEKLMIPVDTKLDPENLRVQQRYLSIADTEKAVAETEGEKEEEEAPAKISPPSTPRLSLDDTGIDYKGPWSHVARRLIPALRQRIDKDRQLAAAKWQEDLMQLLTERASQQGLEMSTSGYLGTSMSLASGEGLPAAPRVIFPPGLEERARQRRAEREERERAEEEKRVEEMLAKEAAHHDSSTVRLSAFGVDDSSTSLDLEQIDISFVDRRKTSVLPASAMSAPKGGRESTMDKLSKKKAIHFQSEVEGD